MELCPVTLNEAKQFITKHHRHNMPPQGHKFSIGLTDNDALIGVCVVGRPIARYNDDGCTAEVTRCCVLEGYRNANSKLYAAAWRAARAMGYQRIITYTLPIESGESLRGAGYQMIGMTQASGSKGWDAPTRPRNKKEKYPEGQKYKWEKRR